MVALEHEPVTLNLPPLVLCHVARGHICSWSSHKNIPEAWRLISSQTVFGSSLGLSRVRQVALGETMF